MSGERALAPIYQHPSSPVTFDPVRDDSGRVIAPAQPEATPRPAGPWDGNQVRMRDDICIGCKLPRAQHYSVSNQFVGCSAALKQGKPPKNPERWNDPYPAVTCDVLRAMHEECGPALDILLYNLTHDEKMAIACQLARVAVSAYLREIAK